MGEALGCLTFAWVLSQADTLVPVGWSPEQLKGVARAGEFPWR